MNDGSGWWSGSSLVASTKAGGGKLSTSTPSMIRVIVAAHVLVGYSAPK